MKPARDMAAVVTGGAGGMGRAIVDALLGAGFRVSVLDVAAAFERGADHVLEADDRLASFEVDVRDRRSVAAAVDRAARHYGHAQVLVTSAGAYQSAPLAEVTEEHWESVLGTNLTGTFNAAQACAPGMHEIGGGSMIFISSTGGKVGWPANHAYCASKAGVLGLMRVLSLELAPARIRVNAVCPGNTDTPMMDLVDADVSRSEGQPKGWFKESLARSIPLGRMASPGDVASLVRFLASADSGHITGQAINVDGGLVPS